MDQRKNKLKLKKKLFFYKCNHKKNNNAIKKQIYSARNHFLKHLSQRCIIIRRAKQPKYLAFQLVMLLKEADTFVVIFILAVDYLLFEEFWFIDKKYVLI